MPVTSRDVAARAGVSPSTVSRAYSRPEKVDPATRARIEVVAKELGYRPNRAAQLLSSGRTGCIAALVPDLNNPFFAGVLKGIAASATAADLQLLVNDFGDSYEAERRQTEGLAEAADGLILCSSRLSDEEIRDLNQKAPVVLVNRQLEGVSYVHFDNAGGIRQAVLHLLALGHRRIGYCAGPHLSRSATERREAFVETAQKEMADAEALILGEYPSTYAGGADAIDEALNAKVSAVVAYNDVVAIGMVSRLLSYGLELPEKMSVVGFDDIPVSAMVSPSLTTVRLPQVEAGALAVKLLEDRLKGAAPEGTEIASTLVLRNSTRRAH